MEENDPAALAKALGTIARARGMSEIAANAGIGREALYKALRPTSQPRFDVSMAKTYRSDFHSCSTDCAKSPSAAFAPARCASSGAWLHLGQAL